jgi:hypothetical protein
MTLISLTIALPTLFVLAGLIVAPILRSEISPEDADPVEA